MIAYGHDVKRPDFAAHPDSYFACESFYNIAKVCKGEILMYFNEIFDALSKVSP